MSAGRDGDPGGGEGQVQEAFVERAARSLSELQANVNNLADVMVFLEILGYNDSVARKGGLSGMFELCERVFERVDFYDEGEHGSSSPPEPAVEVPSARRRLIESLGLATPWLGALALLYVFGVSLWLAWVLPLDAVTALMVGVFLGILVSEGPLQAFTRVFTFYHLQGNVSECSRALKRCYLVLGLLLSCSVAGLALSASLLDIPPELAGLAIVAAVAIAVHRIGFLPIFALKKVTQIVVSYGIALPLLVAVFELTPGAIPDPVARYLVSVAAALGVLSVFAWHSSKKSLVLEPDRPVTRDAPHFFKSSYVNLHTIKSKFSVQFWESLPYYLSGTFFFMLIFGDRVLSWLANPVKEVGGVELPLVFNTYYHSGADLALVVLFPVAIVQYVTLSSVNEELHNLSLRLPVTRAAEMDGYIRWRHARSLFATLTAAIVTAIVLIWFGPDLITRLGGSEASVQILYVAALADVLVSIFVANSSFMFLLTAPKAQAAIPMAGVLALGSISAVMLPLGFGYLAWAYLGACGLVATLSVIYVAKMMASPSSLYFARFT